jgi:DNA-binding XRE family transcriptional regulator
MSWGDHDTDLINKKLNVPARVKEQQRNNVDHEKDSFLKHKQEDEEKNLAYRNRDWYALGYKDGAVRKGDYGYKNNFAKNLRIIRIAFGLTMEELKNQSGVSMQTIGKYEKGDTEPTVGNLLKLAETMNVSVSYLISANLKLEVNEER